MMADVVNEDSGFCSKSDEMLQDDDDEDDEWAEFASHDTEMETQSLDPCAERVAVLRNCFSTSSSTAPACEHVTVPPRSELQEDFMNLIMKRNFAHETSLPGRSSLWLDLLPTFNLFMPMTPDDSPTGPLSSLTRLGVPPSFNLPMVPVSFDLDLPPVNGCSSPSSPVSSLLGVSSISRSGSLASISRSGSLTGDGAKIRGIQSDVALPSGSPAACNVSQHPSKLSMRISGEAREAMQRSPSPDVELGFAEDVAARGLAQLSLESLQQMHSEMLDKTQRLSDELVSGLEARDRFLRSIKTRNEFVAALLQLQAAVCGGNTRKNSDSGRSLSKRDASKANKYLSSKLMYKGSPSDLKPSSLERLTNIMTSMVAGSADVSSLVSRYLAIDVFETETDIAVSPMLSPSDELYPNGDTPLEGP